MRVRIPSNNSSSSYLLEPVEALIISLNGSRFSGGVHGHQAIANMHNQAGLSRPDPLALRTLETK